MNNSHTAAGLFDLSIAIEREMVTFYCRLRQLFSYCPAVRDFWTDMRDEEIEHIVQLRQIKESLPAEKLAAPVDPQWMEKGSRTLEEVKNRIAEPINNLDQAYELAHEWENAEVNRIFMFLAEKFVSDQDRRKIAEEMIDNHLEKMMDFIPGYRTPMERIDVRVQ